jgi:peptide subunit release factor 1 (eRF1)
MTLVKCTHCGAERELTYGQIKTVHLEKRTCPSCGIGTEAVVIKETRFQPLAEHVKVAEPSVNVGLIPDTTSAESQEPKADEGSGIAVGPGGSVTRRRRQVAE